MQFNDDLRIGPVYLPNPDRSGPSPQELGVGPLGRVFIWDVVPATISATGVAAAQTALTFVLLAAGGSTAITLPSGAAAVRLDCPRNVTLTSAGDVSGVNFTISGLDVYGQAMSQVIAGPNANTVATAKAFSIVSSITASGAIGTATSAGYGDSLGIPFRVTDRAYAISVKWDNTLADNAGTLTPAVLTDPATTTTGDVRGTYLLSSASNGTRRLVMAIALPGIAVGPNATRTGAAGVTQA